MSALGPGLATGDVDGDGDFDLFLGGAAGQPGRVIVWNAEQQAYKPMPQPALDADRDFEDMGAVWLDVDNDRDLDLFVASGGNERAIDSEFYQPRLYLNDGSGKLTRSNEWLPQLRVSAGPVCAADIDQDGRVDLFVGGRQVPGRYPLPATSYFLRNTGNRFEDASETFFGDQLKECGMVSGAIFTDVDQDADLDLILAREWDHLLLLRNEANGFQDASAEAGLASFRGWWTGVTAFDCDDDGDLDYVATNLGQNTKYHASDAEPFRIYYGDFEGTGERKLVEAEYESDTLFPVRGKSCSTHAMPSLAEKFTTYKQFAAATLEEIYTPQCLDEAYQCSANMLSSVLIRNDGRGRFTFLPLPAEAQMSPGFGVVTQDFDGDGNRDVLMAQNFFSPQPETGNFDGGLGVLLRGHGDGTFEAVSPGDSGIVIPGDATAIVFNGNQFPQDKVAAIVAVNNDSPRWLPGERTSPQITVRFQDVTSAAEVAGGVLRVQFANGEKQVHEVSAGSGYLSQQPPVIMFTTPSEQGGQVTWTYRGETQKLNFSAKDREIQFPKR